MRKFFVKVNNQQFEVELEELKSTQNIEYPSVNKSSKSFSNGNGPVQSTTAGGGKIISPMPGSILKVNIKVGDLVKKGQVLLVLEAMKMENEITSPVDGKITEVKVEQGLCITAGEVMVVIE